MAQSATLPNVELQQSTRDFLTSGPKKLFIGGGWVDAASGETFASVNPATGDELVQIASAGNDDVDQAVKAAREAFESDAWRNMSGVDRGNLLWKIADLMEAHTQELAELETLDNGKTIRVSSKVDVPQAVKHFRYYAGWASKLEGTTIPVSFPNQLVYTLREPMGVVGLIIPWNFPIMMAAWKLAPALACGNTAVLKPAEETPLTALRLGELMMEAGVPAGVVNIITGPGVPTGSSLVEHPDVDKVAFTGSTEVGRKIMAAAANSNLKRVSLELGGKSPNVIFADADLAKAIKGATWAVFSTTGQECVAGTRLFVQRDIYDAVVNGLAEESQKIRVGSGFDKVHLGPVISEQQLNRIMGYIDSGVSGGAQMVSGGERIGGDLANGYFLPPTIFTHENDELKIVKEEIFGPVVAVTPFEDWDELVNRANDTHYGLAAGVWTQDITKAHRFAQAVKAGTVWINNYGYIDAAAPFGGYKESGFGREMGKEALDLYTQTKAVWVNLG
jgi:acyl-CoA reductase-like NAD-dependent aldehyde dehydrogenase